jgi:hypothetical protein
MRPVRNHSQTVAFVNQLLDRDTLQADSIPLDKSEHFTDGFALRTVCSSRAPRSLFLPENLQSFANHFLEAVEVARLQLFFDDLFLFRRQVDIHRLRLHWLGKSSKFLASSPFDHAEKGDF